jgi:cytochrome c-type biogenesis protein CcmH
MLSMTRLQRTVPILILALWLLLAGSGVVAAQNPTPSDNEVNRVAKQLFCPVCENIPLDVCPTQACAEWRELIRQKLAAGWSDEKIKDYFALQYGDRVLSEPPRRGLNWLVYFLPPLFFLGGVAIVYTVLRRMRSTPAPSTPEPASVESAGEASDDAYLRKVEEELKKQN